MIKNLPKNNIFAIALLLLSVLLLAACKKEQQPVPVPANPAAYSSVTTPKAVTNSIKPVQVQLSSAQHIKPPQASSQFDFSNKKDPFKPFISSVQAEQKNIPIPKNGKNVANALPIHSFDVTQFKLIGIIVQKAGHENKAMVVDPGGKGYVLKKGMQIGRNHGKVISITANEVKIQESTKNDKGKPANDPPIILTLHKKQ